MSRTVAEWGVSLVTAIVATIIGKRYGVSFGVTLALVLLGGASFSVFNSLRKNA